MSFDLYVLDLDGTPDAVAVHALIDDVGGVLTAPLQALVDELETRYPNDDSHADDSAPWASWPLTQPVAAGRGNAFRLGWASADSVTEALIEAAARHALVIFDPQSDLLVPPSAARVGATGQHRSVGRRRWWRRS